MPDQTIRCPQCNTAIPLTEAISHQVRESARKEWEAEAARLRAEVTQKEQAVLARARELEESKKSLDQQVTQRVSIERERLVKEARLQLEQQMGVEIRDLKQQVDDKNRKLADAQAQELELRRQRRELEERQKAFEVE